MDKARYYFVIASYMGEDWVNAPAMWECYKKAAAVYEENGLGDNLRMIALRERKSILSYLQ